MAEDTDQELADPPTELVAYFRQEGLSWGGADLAVVGDASAIARAAEVTAILLGGFRDEQGQPRVQQLIIVLPPAFRVADEDVAADVRAALGIELSHVTGQTISDAQLDVLATRVRIVRSLNLTTSSLADRIRQSEACSATLVLEAALYRSASVPPDYDGVRLREDVWAEHLTSLADVAVEAAQASGSYVFLDAGEFAPWRAENLERLCSVSGCGVVTARGEGADERDVAGNSARWLRLAQEGRLGAALAEIEALELPQNRRTFIALHLYNSAGFKDHAKAELEANPELLEGLTAPAAIHVAQLAEGADADHIARRLLAGAVAALQNQELLETGLRLADRIEDPELADAYVARLAELFPGSSGLRFRRIRRFVQVGQLDRAEELAREDGRLGESADLFALLSERLAGDGSASHDAVLDEVACRFPGLAEDARLICAADLERRGRRREALELLLPPDASPRALLVWDALQVLERSLLIDAADVDADVVVSVIRASAHYLSAHMADGPIRARLTRLLRPQVLGGRGDTMMILLLVEALRAQVGVRPAHPLSERAQPADPEEVLVLMRTAATWLEEERVAVLGARPFPRERLTLDPDEALAGLTLMVQHLAARVEDEGDHKALDLYLVVAAAIAPHATLPNQDLAVLRLAANLMALSGHGQRARDLAEQMLRLAGDDPVRRRIAWFGFGDIYARLRNNQEALIGLICALVADTPATWEQIWYESSLAFRILRDHGLAPAAQPVVANAGQALEGLGLTQEFGHRLRAMELQIEFATYQADEPDTAQLQNLMARMAANAREASENNDEPAVSATLLASMLLLARRQGFDSPQEVETLMEELIADCHGRLATLLKAITTPNPTAEEVLSLAQLLERPRYTEDLAFDVRTLAIAARRLLDSSDSQDPQVVVFATDLLADQAVTLPGESHAPDRTPTLPPTVGTPLTQALALSRQGLSVVTLAMAEDALVRVTITDGAVAGLVREAQETFSIDRFEAWGVRYPHAYGDAPDLRNPDLNLFYSTTDGLGLSELPDRAVVVMGADLQGFPVNLLRIGDELAGRDHALATAPSLAWLSAARTRTPARAPRTVAWIPDAVPEVGIPSLQAISKQLQPTFDTYGVQVSHDLTLPRHASGAELVIAAAHGQVVARERRYFRSLRDDVSLALAPSTLSDGLAQAGVVVLFVCSGGRIDEHPGASTTVGLAKQLLDSGCSAVIAPPWPLYVGVPARWLPTFMAQWAAGQPVIDACFAANAAVRAQLGETPAWWLAMSVYGDPLVTRTADRRS